MQCTPESNAYPESFKNQHCFDFSDSGYSGFFQSPLGTVGVDSCRSLSPEELDETPKENLKVSASPKKTHRESLSILGKDSRELLRPSALSWCETPKIYKRDASLRHRLPMCKPTSVKNDVSRSPRTRGFESSTGVRSAHWLSVSFDSLDITSGGGNPFKPEQDLPLSGRKRRLLFTQVRTSTLEDGKSNNGHLSAFERSSSLAEADFSESISACDQVETPCSVKFLKAVTKENAPSPVSSGSHVLWNSSSVLSTPSFTQTPKYTRYACEDSGFGSLTFEKSQNSSADHDGSFQELLLSASRGSYETPNLADAKRRSRLQRQHRLSTLREGGSQSEEDSADRKHQQKCRSHSKGDEVFANDATPRSISPAACKYFKSLTCTKHISPFKTARAKPESATPCSADSSNPAFTPLRTTPVNLSLTPALQLVHTMCQHKIQMLAGQSPTLKEELKSTAALTKTPVTFRTTMPLAGLIGRKMGLGNLDVLTELKKRNLRHILAVIFSKLDSESVYRCGQVCKSWNEIIQQDKHARLRRRNHQREVDTPVEHGGAVPTPDADTRAALLGRSALKTVQAQSRTSSFCTPQSAGGSSTPSQQGAVRSGGSSKRDKFLGGCQDPLQ